ECLGGSLPRLFARVRQHLDQERIREAGGRADPADLVGCLMLEIAVLEAKGSEELDGFVFEFGGRLFERPAGHCGDRIVVTSHQERETSRRTPCPNPNLTNAIGCAPLGSCPAGPKRRHENLESWGARVSEHVGG